jgi:hypothetical protein
MSESKKLVEITRNNTSEVINSDVCEDKVPEINNRDKHSPSVAVNNSRSHSFSRNVTPKMRISLSREENISNQYGNMNDIVGKKSRHRLNLGASSPSPTAEPAAISLTSKDLQLRYLFFLAFLLSTVKLPILFL